ncbi:16S rRNA (uracil(1498)-N(3))-methyltransferase [Exilibacterium tricleocarpae]|uniref:Ribosomal RNA small subunit methyltransferase E n=1 Tax=Exilibacterium tricleocarpae TaxID=2591008 RepID=A0A545SXH0_9GAMM|nr:16S rRNA (uracil(1498)-N(3))-methyltransferase [Exilibacterium tricleocarpae]TQV69651.1 16S rRNA (uracil(1498)-N(3))-methyltransferase [Exilibacterium tricleocarpae]
MRVPRIYTPQNLNDARELRLAEGPSRHLVKVLRMQVGRDLVVFNGRGGEYRARITAIDKRNVDIELLAFNEIERESPLHITLGIGISKGERMDWVMQKATELGVASISPLFTGRTEVKLSGERLEKKHHHWQQIVASTCEQCQRNRLPELDPLQSLHDWLPQVTATRKFVLHHRAGGERLSAATRPESVALLIGPEGGLDAGEISASQAQGFEALALGPRVLRTETAPLVAISLLQHLWGDL